MAYTCPKCNHKVDIKIKGKHYCIDCGSEMQRQKLYSEIIWPLKKAMLKKLGYSKNELYRIKQEIEFIENMAPSIGDLDITISIPRIDLKDIYELRENLDEIEEKVNTQIDDQLKLSELREWIEERDDILATLTGYSHSGSPIESHKITINYLRKRVEETCDDTLRDIMKKLEQELHRYEIEWRPTSGGLPL